MKLQIKIKGGRLILWNSIIRIDNLRRHPTLINYLIYRFFGLNLINNVNVDFREVTSKPRS